MDYGRNEEGIGELTIYHAPDERLKSGMLISTMGASISSDSEDYSLSSGHMADFYRGIVDVLKNMGYETVAEGVETEGELELASRWGVDYIQGYYFSKPFPEKEILEFLREKTWPIGLIFSSPIAEKAGGKSFLFLNC